MKKIFTYSILSGIAFGVVLVILVFMTGCSVVKKSVERERMSVVSQAHHDTSATAVKVVEHFTSEKETKDSAVGIAGGSVSYTEVTQANPDSSALDTVIRDGHLSLRIYTDRKGQRRIDCAADSLTIVIRSLTRENTVLRQRNDSSASSVVRQDFNESVATTLEEFVVKENAGFVALLKRICSYLLVFGCGVLFGKWVLPLIS